MVEHKHNIEKIQRQRHNKVVTQLYESFRSEVEAGLLAYKEARQEWLEVFTVVDEVRRMLAETNASQTTQVRQSNNQMNMLHSTLVDAKKRQQMCMESSKTLDAHKEELHRGIHDMTIQHKHDLQRMCTTVEALCAEIRRLRTENRRKQQVIDGLCKDIDGDKF
ncbi:uncharacterized protein LOC111062000 [Nilaparvata lugens]|uniref:uncharacterized protein LOC111062000 n=1 Tax=Nilaparvata lugens TaxID=108931 RepID=UPI00193DDA7D|nr:uncharacterized protein LOC111062000 [Nilaparvata lugens]